MPAGSLARPLAEECLADGTPLLLMPMPPTCPTPPRRRASGLVVLVVALAAPLLAGVPVASAEDPVAPVAPAAPRTLLAPPSPALPGLPQTAIELAQVPVDGPAFRRAAERYASVDGSHSAARGARAGIDTSLTALRGTVVRLTHERSAAQARIAGLTARLVVLERAIQDLAVHAFVGGDDDDRLAQALASETPAIHEADRRQVYSGLSMDVLLTERAAYRERVAEARARIEAAEAGLAAAEAAADDLRGKRPPAVEEERVRAEAVAQERVAYEEARVLATVEGVDFPLVALDAYHRAAAAVEEEHPRCGVRWWAVAGISRVEGRHGTYGGTELLPNGDTSRRIIGIQLNGERNTAVIGDTDGGAIDGDPAYDRAVGPMQFIPQTWRRFQADGNGDDVRSPFNLYDATRAAADYLCTASSRLDGEDGLRRAYFAYNHSTAYVDAVLGFARLYERSVAVPEPPS